MSITPSTPNFNIRSFWQRPEGKTGALVLAATACAGLYGASMILPWAIAFATDMIHLGILVGVLIAVLYVITNKQFRSIMGNVFRLSMRWLTSMVVEIDPIGILKNNLDKMREQNEQLAKGIEGCAGAKRQLENQIAKNSDTINHNRSLVDEATKRVSMERDPIKQQSWVLRKNSYLQEIGRRMHSNENLQKILTQTSKMYDMLARWQNLAEFNIENTASEISNADEERKSILASYKALGPAQRLIRGDPQELQMMNASLEYLATDNANKLGAMEDFARYSEKYLNNMDLEQGASAADAEKMLSQFEQKLVTAGTPSTGIPSGIVRGAQAVPVPRSSSVVEGDYLDYK